MEHARKMALVDPRLLDTLRSPPPPPPPTDTLGKKVQALDDEMMTILDRKDLDDRTKVTLCNQVLQRYNVLSDKHVKEPVRVVAVNESGAGAGVTEGAVGAPASGTEADVVATVPKTMQAKARRLMEHIKIDISWTARGKLIHEGVPVAGSNVVDLVNDLLRKRKTNPTGWQPFARQLRAMNLPMELVSNVARRDYIRQATTLATPTPGRRRRAAATPRSGAGSARRSLSWTPLACRTFHAHPSPRTSTQGFCVIGELGRHLRRCGTCPLHSVRYDERSTGHIPFRHRCDILRWTLLAW